MNKEQEHFAETASAVGEYDPYGFESMELGEDWEFTGQHGSGDDGRWSETIWTIWQHLPTGTFYAAEWERGLTEMQETMHYGVIHQVTPIERTIKDWVTV